MDWSALTSTFLAVTFIRSGFDEISDSSPRHHPSKSKFLLKFGSPCQGVKVRVLEGAAFQPVSWNHTRWGDSWKGSHCKDWEFLPMVISEGQGANAREEAMACRALPLICSVWHQPRLCQTAIHPGCKGTAAPGHTTWDRLPQTQAPPRVWCGLPHFSPYLSSGPKLCTITVKSLISLLRKYCKTLCFSCLISFRFPF